MYRCMTDPGYRNLIAGYGYGSVSLAWQARDTDVFLYYAQIGQAIGKKCLLVGVIPISLIEL